MAGQQVDWDKRSREFAELCLDWLAYRCGYSNTNPFAWVVKNETDKPT